MKGIKLPKLLIFTCLALVICALPALTACSGDGDGATTTVTTTVTATAGASDSQDSFVYRLATGSPEMNNATTNEMKEWAANVEEATGGRLTIEIFWAGALGESKDALAMLDSGIADMVMEGYGYFSDTFPVSDVITLPYLVTSTVACGTLMNSLMADGLLPEYDNIKLLMFKPQDPVMIFLRDTPVTTMEDLSGQKIRTNTQGWTTVIEALGGVPTSVATPDLFTSLETGVIDGIVTSLGFFYPMGLSEVCNYALVEPMGASMTFIAMSQDAWDRLPADLQLILSEVTNQYYWNNTYRESDRFINEYLIPVEQAGVELLYLTEAERARWVEATSFMVDDWVAEVDAKGYAGTEAVRRARLLDQVLK